MTRRRGTQVNGRGSTSGIRSIHLVIIIIIFSSLSLFALSARVSSARQRGRDDVVNAIDVRIGGDGGGDSGGGGSATTR